MSEIIERCIFSSHQNVQSVILKTRTSGGKLLKIQSVFYIKFGLFDNQYNKEYK